ncbi:MAG: hypothetical protein JXA97_01875 [Anaerolineales bacterium]|nr:hypothetical protein [Anaerolineales bacterium]
MATEPENRGRGAGTIYAGSIQPFYLALGFEHPFTSRPWAKPDPGTG